MHFRDHFVSALSAIPGYDEESAKRMAAQVMMSSPDLVQKLVLDNLVEFANPNGHRIAGLIAMLDIYFRSYKPIQQVAADMKHILKDDVYQALADSLDSDLDYSADFTDLTGFSVLTLQRGRYLAAPKPKTISTTAEDGSVTTALIYGLPYEVPQQMYYRIACAAYPSDKIARMEVYDMLKKRILSPASPVLFNMGMRKGLPTSCMTTTIPDSLEGIYGTLAHMAKTSNSGAGHGIDMSGIRKSGNAMGILKLMILYNESTEYVNQGGRKGATTLSLRVFHKDVDAFIDAGNLAGKEGERIRTAKMSLMVNDSFMNRVVCPDTEDSTWYLFCPHECPELAELYGKEFEAAYLKRVADPTVSKVKHDAKNIWRKIVMQQANFSQPFIAFDCNINRKNVCGHIDRVRAFNLCQEMCLISTPEEYIGTCNLSALNLSKFVENGEFQFADYGKATEIATRFVNRVIDRAVTNNPLIDRTNTDMRPLGLGVAGFADMIHKLDIPLVFMKETKKGRKYQLLNPVAKELNRNIWRCMYYHALKSSNEEAKIFGPCARFAGCPASQGILNQDLFRQEGIDTGRNYQHDWDAMYPGQPGTWDDLRKEIIDSGLRNMSLLSVQPTASTAQIIGVSEAAEMYTSNIYMRRVLHGEYPVINEFMFDELRRTGHWTADTFNHLRANRGSIATCESIPLNIREKYLTMWDISSQIIVDLAADRQVYICHSQSMNLYPQNPDQKTITAILTHGWKSGLKTGVYYMQARSASVPLQFGFDSAKMIAEPSSVKEEDCVMCVN